jgi:phytoene desaturase
MQGKHITIVGAGLGGLAAALRLTSKGYKVTIIDKHYQAGGRLNRLQKDGFSFDVGPSFFSMSYEFDELFKYCGIKNPLVFNELNPVYSVYFSNRSKPYFIHKDLKKLSEEFKEIEPDFERKATEYLKRAASIFHDTENKVVKRNFNSLFQYFMTLSTVPLKHAPLMFRSMWKELDKYFASEDVKIIFSLVAFFLGATPFNTPAVYSLLNYTELQHDGYWNVKGGMYDIVTKITEILKKRGVEFVFNTEIVSFNQTDDNKITFIDNNGRTWQSDKFIINSDAAAFRGSVLKRKKYTEKKLDKLHWTLAPFTIYLGVKGKLENIHHHNYFLGDNFKQYADNIFTTSISPDKPYYYVNVSSKSNPECAPEGCENIFILCPVPDLRYKNNWSDKDHLADTIIKDLSSRIGFDMHANTLTRTVYTPIDWRNMFNLYKGSGLGLAHDMKQIGAFRPSNKDEEFSNLYYVGASTTPGTGLPIVVISSKLVTERVLQDDGVI